MSGLYGLIAPTEPIQNYDVHLTDVDTSVGISVQSYWRDRELMTQILRSHLEWIENNHGPVFSVIDLLSEVSYQETILWSMIDRTWPVFHRIFERNTGRDALANMGVWVQDVIREPDLAKGITYDRFYPNPRFQPPDQIAFEAEIGGSGLAVARETGA